MAPSTGPTESPSAPRKTPVFLFLPRLPTGVNRGYIRDYFTLLSRDGGGPCRRGETMKARRKKSYVGLYGNVSLQKAFCLNCQSFSFVLDDVLACCGIPPSLPPNCYKRESQPHVKRRLPPLRHRQAKHAEQEGRCFYCDRTLGSYVFRGGRTVKLRIHWDHQVPFAYSQNNAGHNFVASCHVCNGIKSDRLFQTVEEARVFIETERRGKGYY